MRNLLLATSALVAISLPGQPVQDEPLVALLDVQVTDTNGYALPGVMVSAVPAGVVKSPSHMRAATNVNGYATIILGGGEAVTLIAELEGFVAEEIRGVQLASGFHYSGPTIQLEVGESGERGWTAWSTLTDPPLPEDDSEFGEWFYEQPEEAQTAIQRGRAVRVMPLIRTPRVVLKLRLGDWDEWGWSSVFFEGASEAHVQLGEYGEARVLLDTPGEYDLKVTSATQGGYQLRKLDLQAGRIYDLTHTLENESKSASWVELVEEFDVSATSFTGEYVELDPDLMDEDE